MDLLIISLVLTIISNDIGQNFVQQFALTLRRWSLLIHWSKCKSLLTRWSMESIRLLRIKQKKSRIMFHYKLSFNHYSEDSGMGLFILFCGYCQCCWVFFGMKRRLGRVTSFPRSWKCVNSSKSRAEVKKLCQKLSSKECLHIPCG